jgi:outer membrane protein assembly factor BamB/subtilisin family serine protease
LGLFLVIAAAGLRADNWQRPPISRAEQQQGYRNDVVLAKPTAARRAGADAEEAAEGSVVRVKFDQIGGIRAVAVRAGETPAQAVARLMATGRYEFVEVDHLRHAAATTPSDPLFSQQWGLSNNGVNSPLSGPGIVGADIHAPAAWDIRHDASSIVVATVDTGLRLTHSDILANLWNNPTAGSDGFTNDQHGIDATDHTDQSAPNDTDGHGTHVAGIIGAVGNNGLDVSGIAWSVQLMALKFLGVNGGDVTDELTCFTFAINHGARIANASFGSTDYDPSELEAVQALASHNIILVCAAGNATEDNDLTASYPCNYDVDNIVAVAATDNRDSLVYFSSYGSGNVDLAAPGYNILSLYNTNDTATAILSGTSMATPMVTGSLALLEAQFPADTYRQTINRLLRHVDRNANLTGIVGTGGRLNLAAALGSAAGDNTPYNDDFADRAHLSGYTLNVRGDNAGATRESGEPVLGSTAAGASVWYEWTAPATGTVTIANTDGSFTPLIGVFAGTSVGALTGVASGTGSVRFAAQAGSAYEIAVDGQNGQSGLVAFSLGYGNSSLSAATALSGASVSVTGTTQDGAARGTPAILNNTPANTVWYTWTAPATAQVQLSVSSPDFDPLLAVYTGTGSALSLVAAGAGATIDSNNVAPVSGTTLGFVATAGVAYSIELGGKADPTTGSDNGQFTLTIANARWAISSTDALDCSPAVAPNGTIYIGGDNDMLYAVNPDGSSQWTYTATGSFDSSSVAIADDGTVYAGCLDGYLYALSPTGALQWKYAVTGAGTNGVACSPAVAADGTIYFKDTASTLYALSPAGTLKWTAAVPGGSYAAPTVAADGTVYIGSDDGMGGGELYAFSATGGSKWAFNAGNAVYTAAALDSAGNLYFSTLGGMVYSLNPAGQQRWSYAAGGGISSAPTLGTNGALYFGSYDHNVYALTAATGALQWTHQLGAQVRASSPVVGGNGVVYIGCYDGFIYGLNPDGTLNRTLATGNYVRSSPALAGTTLYVGSADCRLYAFDLGSSLGGSGWAEYMGGNRRLGRAVTDDLAIVSEPVSSTTVSPGVPLTLSVAAIGQGPLSYQWYLNGSAISGATNSALLLLNPSSASDGSYTVTVSGSQGSITSTAEVLGPLAAPVITAAPASQTVNAGGTVNLTVAATGGSLSDQWYFGGTAIAGATGPNLFLTNVGANQGSTYGSYTVTVTNSLGSASSAPANLTVSTAARLLNLSASGDVGSASADYLVVGFVTAGGIKQMLVRGVGPALGAFGIGNFLPDPTLNLFSAGSSAPAFATNAGWANDPALAAAFTATGAFAFAANSLDSALLRSLPSGGYSAQVSGTSGDAGVALAEIYDDDPSTSAARLINLSARANVGTGADIATAGFVITGTTSETVLIRGVGPTLSSFGLSGVLSAASLTLYTSGQTALQTNADWALNSGLSAVFLQVGAFALSSSGDAALIATLPPGQYTAQLSGVGSATGVALVEIWEVR